LVSDFDLSTGGTIVLFAKEDGTFKVGVELVLQMLLRMISIQQYLMQGGSIFRFTG
jgi:hypothetical protein